MAMQNFQAKKSLGQNFLTSKKFLLEMINAGKVSGKDTVLEIGPGQGNLTEELLATGAKIISVEKDQRLIDPLKEKFSREIKSSRLEIIHGDILEIDLSKKLKNNSFKLIANIPYYITGLIFRKFLSEDLQPSKIVMLVQKEIADRIVARDGKESLLSISIKVYGSPKKITNVSRGNFIPMPKVDSAILLIDNISKDFFKKVDEKLFFDVIKAGFAHKRKVLISNLRQLFNKKGGFDAESLKNAFSVAKIPENSRAEDLKISDWDNLISKLSN